MERDIVSSTILHNQAKLNDQLDPKFFILLDNQFMLDIICNKKITSKINKSDKKISVQGNRGTLTIKYKYVMPGYNYGTCYSKDAIANIISMKNMIRQDCVTYDSDDQKLIVHQETSALPDI